MEKLSREEQKDVEEFVAREQRRAQLNTVVHEFTEYCFDKCFTGKIKSGMESKERQCMVNCTERFIDTTKFMVDKFQ